MTTDTFNSSDREDVIVFWPYDLFPFVLSGAGIVQNNGDVLLLSGQRRIRREDTIAIYPKSTGKEIQEKVKAAEIEYRMALDEAMRVGMERAGIALPELRPWRKRQGRTPA